MLYSRTLGMNEIMENGRMQYKEKTSGITSVNPARFAWKTV